MQKTKTRRGETVTRRHGDARTLKNRNGDTRGSGGPGEISSLGLRPFEYWGHCVGFRIAEWKELIKGKEIMAR
jgi:hypothetical protein